MATFTTTRIGSPARRHKNGVFGDIGTYEASAIAAGSVIQMVRVAAGVTLLDLYTIHDALGTGVTLDVGDGDDVDRYIDGATGNATSAVSAVTGIPHQYASDDTIDITILGAAATGTITLVVYMVAEQVDLT